MDFRRAPSQQILTTTARAFLRQHYPPEHAQRLALHERGFDEPLWRRMAELGWPGLLIPADLGGSEGSLHDVILLVEEMGRVGLAGPFVAAQAINGIERGMVLQIVIVPRDWLPHEYRLDTVDLGHALDLALVLQISMDDRFKLVAVYENPTSHNVDAMAGVFILYSAAPQPTPPAQTTE